MIKVEIRERKEAEGVRGSTDLPVMTNTRGDDNANGVLWQNTTRPVSESLCTLLNPD